MQEDYLDQSIVIADLIQKIFVSDLKRKNRTVKQAGFIVLNETPKKGADNKLVVFLHPKTTNGVLIELCQEIE